MPSGKPKIIMVGPARGVKGGVSSVVNVLLGSALVERYDIHYISSHHDKGLVVKLWYAMRGFVVFAYKAVLYQIPVVHIHMASRASFFRKSIFVLFSKIINRKVVLHIHGAEFHLFYYIESGRVKRWFIRSVMRSAACVIVLSPEWRTRLGELFAKDQEVKVINNAISLPPAKEDYVSGNIVRVLFMGRIGERKGVVRFSPCPKIVAYSNPMFGDHCRGWRNRSAEGVLYMNVVLIRLLVYRGGLSLQQNILRQISLFCRHTMKDSPCQLLRPVGMEFLSFQLTSGGFLE